MKYLYKYTPHNTEYKYDIITKSQLWFSKVENFNDPIDSKLDYRQQYTSDEILQYWKNFLKNKPEHPQTIEEILHNWGNNSSFIEQQNREKGSGEPYTLFFLIILFICVCENPS